MSYHGTHVVVITETRGQPSVQIEVSVSLTARPLKRTKPPEEPPRLL